MTDKQGGSSANAGTEDDELSVPRASVNKMIRELAPNLRISNETRELIINCCNEFIHLLATGANTACNNQQKKTIAPEHVLQALENLGFKDYLADIKECVQEAKQVAIKKRRQSTKLEHLGIPEEELLRQQQELFQKAREEQAAIEQQEWVAMQQQASLAAYQAAGHMGYYMPPQAYIPQQQLSMQNSVQSAPAQAPHTAVSNTKNASNEDEEDDDDDEEDDEDDNY